MTTVQFVVVKLLLPPLSLAKFSRGVQGNVSLTSRLRILELMNLKNCNDVLGTKIAAHYAKKQL